MTVNAQSTSSASHKATCSAGWFLTGWQRKWTRTTGNDGYVARVYSRVLDAEDRYQRENRMGRYSLPNANVDLPDTAAQDSASKSNNPAVSG